ncbi:thiamine diphosphokinase [Weissella viridescens]|uniref:thiamine diphosphokinase n=1 Tax=Weissella viridescens TaxID=1629 RepID=UPI0025782E0A|nr:thiamine diphosphokinase [Weissella viridescens]WJI91700.1 thiamine diphosphokinase [Weissella viridescens]
MGDTFQVLVGGPEADWPAQLKQGQLSGRWAAADRGALRLLALGYQPELVVGDFDSMSKAEQADVFQQVAHVVTKTDQNQTDTELLLTTLEQMYDIEQIDIYGATGGRIDQFFSNIWIFTNPKFQSLLSKVRVVDRYNEITFYEAGQHTVNKSPQMKYLGFMPLTPVTHLTLIDEKYPLQQWSGNPYSWSSNEFVGDTNHFSFESGIVSVIQSRDAEI